MSQPGTRKRPAPGALPITQDLPQPSTYNTRSTRQNTGSNTHRLQSQSPTSATIPLDPSLVCPTSNPASMAPQTMLQGTANQLARRPVNQTMLARNAYQNGSSDGWSGMAQPQKDSNWASSPEDERLEQEALQAMDNARKTRKAIPPFVQKLRSFLEDPKNTNLIRWSRAGDSFIVYDEEEFAKTLIPELFKHANYASFVRQLNMYGFHKKVGLSDNSMRASERKNKSPSEYANQYFRRDKPDWMWLIAKPKTVPSKGKGSRAKQSDGHVEDEDEVLDGETPIQAGPPLDNGPGGIQGVRQPLMIGQGDPSLVNEQLASVHQELRMIRQQHQMISNVIQKLRREHEQQAAQFQELHNRHENSINAILTFLATVYNRSLEGAGNQNLGNIFAGSMPPELGQSSQVVDVGDINVSGLNAQNGQIRRSPRRAPLLLKAPPPSDAQTIHTMSTASTPAATGDAYSQPPTGGVGGGARIEELQTPTPTSAAGMANQAYGINGVATPNSPEPDILSMINSANAQDANAGHTNRMSFPQALSHLQTADGKVPLTNQERNGTLQRMANDTGAPAMGNRNNGMTPEQPDLSGLGDLAGSESGVNQWAPSTEADFAFLERTMKEQNDKMSNVSNVLRPLSPSGSIPGLHDGSTGYVPQPNINFDELFNTCDYFSDANNDAGNSDMFGDVGANTNFDFAQPADNGNAAGFPVPEEEGGPVIETVNNSEATSPADTVEDLGTPDEAQSPRKRRRRN